MRAAVWVGAVALLTGGSAVGQEAKPNVVGKLEGHRGGVASVLFNPQLPLVATGSGNGVVRIWDERGGKLAFRIDPQKQNGARVNHIGFSGDGYFVSTSSKNAVVVWDLSPPPVKEPADPKSETPPPPAAPRQIPIIFEDGQGSDPGKIGTVAGNRKRAFYTATEGARVTVNSNAFSGAVGANTADELRGTFTPWAVSAIPDPESELVAMYGTVRSADKTEPAVAFVGLGDGKILGRGTIRTPVAGRPVSIGFAPDGKWLIVCNGEDLMYWRVPGSQVVEGDPKLLANAPAFAAAAGPNGKVAFASPPEDGKKVKVTIADISGPQSKVVAVYGTDIDRISALAFNPDGTLLAVGDDTEGVVQLWSLEKK